MQTVEIDGLAWSHEVDIWHALQDALTATPGHGTGFDAFEDSVFYNPEMLGVRPPFEVIARGAPPFAAAVIERMAEGWASQRRWRKEHYGDDVEATIRLATR